MSEVSHIIFTGAGSNGKTTLKQALLRVLSPVGWSSLDATASGKKEKLGIDMKHPTVDEKALFQALGFHDQLFSDLIHLQSFNKIIAERCAIDFAAFTDVLVPNQFEHQLEMLYLAQQRGLYAHAKIYYVEPLPVFYSAYNRFEDRGIYASVEESILNILALLDLPFTRIASDTTVEERVRLVVDDCARFPDPVMQKLTLSPL